MSSKICTEAVNSCQPGNGDIKRTNTDPITGVIEKANVKKKRAAFGGPSNISTNGRSL